MHADMPLSGVMADWARQLPFYGEGPARVSQLSSKGMAVKDACHSRKQSWRVQLPWHSTDPVRTFVQTWHHLGAPAAQQHRASTWEGGLVLHAHRVAAPENSFSSCILTSLPCLNPCTSASYTWLQPGFALQVITQQCPPVCDVDPTLQMLLQAVRMPLWLSLWVQTSRLQQCSNVTMKQLAAAQRVFAKAP